MFIEQNNFLSILLIIFVVQQTVNVVYSFEINLNQGWNITNQNESILLQNQIIPSGVYSALELANITESVLYDYNDVNLRWVSQDSWTYTMNFQIEEKLIEENATSIILVFHGIDTEAIIYLNDHILGKTNNMFVRYRFNIGEMVRLNNMNNLLKIQFISPIKAAKELAERNSFTPPVCPPNRYHGECHMNFLRKMQASFSWDWGLAAPSVGLWKPVTLELYDSAIIRDVTYNIKEINPFWQVDVTVYLESGESNINLKTIEGYLSINLDSIFDEPIKRHVVISQTFDGEFIESFTFIVSKDCVKLWWPNEYGDQTLYSLNAKWEGEIRDIQSNRVLKNKIDNLNSEKTIKIGFRTIELVEEPIDHGLSFYFRVNNLPIFMKGTNWIPLHILPEKQLDKSKIDSLLLAVKNAHMNMIRVWGGGVYESDYFYEQADKLGILIWQDMMFACAMYPVFSEFLNSVSTEIKQNIRRIQSHPSIAVWAGNNENEAALRQNWYGTRNEYNRFVDEYIRLYDNVIKKEVIENDQWHIWLYSSPSNGIVQSNQSIIQTDPQDWHYGDIHYYNYLSNAWDSNIYPKPRFVSEYGFQSFPSLQQFKLMLRSIGGDLANFIDHRQHSPMGNMPIIKLVNQHLPLPAVSMSNDTDEIEKYLEALIYFSQISQAMAIKTETEVYRVERGGEMNTMGALYWQLNDIWVAPSWSSIEYNGNYKILQHWAQEFFAPTAIIVQCDNLSNVNVYCVRDVITAESNLLTAQLRIFHWSNLDVKFEKTINVSMASTETVKHLDTFLIDDYLTQSSLNRSNSVMEFLLKNEKDFILSTTYIFPDKIKNAIGIIKDPKIQVSITKQLCSDDQHIVMFEINIQYPTIFLYIQIDHPIITQYKFNKNGFMLLKRTEMIQLTYENINCSIELLEKNIKILTVNQYFK